MSVIQRDGKVLLVGDCPSDEAEVLLRLLQENPEVAVDWTGCERAHTAVVQVLLAANRPVQGPPLAGDLKRWIEPLFAGTRD